MAIRTVIKIGEPKLRKKSVDVPINDIQTPYIQGIIQDLSDTLLEYKTKKGIYKGVGLAANQIGINYRIFIIHIPPRRGIKDDPHCMPLTVFINPKLVNHGEKTTSLFEGCMSFKHYRAIISRFDEVEVEAYDQHAQVFRMKLKGFKARVFQHEYDHLEGIMYIDKADTRTLITQRQYKLKWMKALPEEIDKLINNQY